MEIKKIVVASTIGKMKKISFSICNFNTRNKYFSYLKHLELSQAAEICLTKYDLQTTFLKTAFAAQYYRLEYGYQRADLLDIDLDNAVDPSMNSVYFDDASLFVAAFSSVRFCDFQMVRTWIERMFAFQLLISISDALKQFIINFCFSFS